MKFRLQSNYSRTRNLLLAVIGLTLLGSCAETGGPGAPQKSISKGLAKQLAANVSKCPPKTQGWRAAPVGIITAMDGTTWKLPAETAAEKGTGPIGHDLYNPCNGVNPKTSAEISTDKIAAVEVDPDGQIITGYVVADNYFELYVNGKLVAVDPVPYSPQNATIVKFKVKRPYTLVIKGVDWEEDLGVGTEKGNANNKQAWVNFYMGDAGIIARFSDGTVTDRSWKAQVFYISPLNDPSDLVEKGNLRDTSKLGTYHPKAPRPGCDAQCYAVHYPIPANFASPSFNDTNWPNAVEWTDEQVGVQGAVGYTRFPELYKGARWIWTSNLVFDNVVIMRKTVR